jgi:hypothetical protein
VANTASKNFEVKFTGNTTDLTNSIQKLQRSAGKLSSSLTSTGQSLTRSLSLPLAGAAVVINNSITDASNLGEAQSKVTAVFKTQAATVTAWSKTMSAAFGVSQRAALEAAGTYGNLFQAFGIGETEAAKMSRKLVELAADMASFNNVPIEEALTALRSGLSGETEPLKRFGVALNDVRLRQEALNLKIYDGQGVLTVAQKAQAAYALILRDTALQQGDVARTAGGLANQKKFLAAQVEDLSGTFGAVFMPILINVVGVIRNQVLPQMQKFIEAFKTLSPSAVVTAIQIGFFAAALGPAMIAVGYMIKMVQGLASAFQFLTKKVVLLPLVILGIVTAMVKGTDATMTWGEATIKVFRGIAIGLSKVGNAFIVVINGFIKGYNALFTGILKNPKINELTLNFSGLVSTVDSAAAGFTNFSNKLKEEQTNLSAIAAEAQSLAEAIDAPGGGGGKAGKSVGGASKNAAEKIAKLTEALSSAGEILNEAKAKFSDYARSVSSSITSVLSFTSAAGAETGTFLENLVAQAAKAADFGTKVRQLLAMGLSESAISQVLSAGADAGIKIADEIIAGGATVVDQVNTLVSATQSVADAVGESAATQFYSAGVAAGQALVDGVKAAIAAAGLSVTATGTIVNQAGIDQVNAAIAKAKGKKSPGKTKITDKERKKIMDLASSLGVEVPAFAKGGIVTGPTLALIGEAGPEAVVPLSGRNAGGLGSQITINVNAGMGADGASIGRDIVDAIKRYERTSGPVFASA